MSIEHNWFMNMNAPTEYSCPSCQQYSAGEQWRETKGFCPHCGANYQAAETARRAVIIAMMQPKKKEKK